MSDFYPPLTAVETWDYAKQEGVPPILAAKALKALGCQFWGTFPSDGGEYWYPPSEEMEQFEVHLSSWHAGRGEASQVYRDGLSLGEAYRLAEDKAARLDALAESVDDMRGTALLVVCKGASLARL